MKGNKVFHMNNCKDARNAFVLKFGSSIEIMQVIKDILCKQQDITFLRK